MNSGRNRQVPLRHQTFDSNGPDVRVRGNAYQVFEKYLALARDASMAGDRIAAENYYQHAEHYFRIINADGNNGGQPYQHPDRRDAAYDAEQSEAGGEQPGGEALAEANGEGVRENEPRDNGPRENANAQTVNGSDPEQPLS